MFQNVKRETIHKDASKAREEGKNLEKADFEVGSWCQDFQFYLFTCTKRTFSFIMDFFHGGRF